MVQSIRLPLEDSKDRESTHLIQDLYFAFPAASQYTSNHLRRGRFLHPFHPKRLGGPSKGQSCPFRASSNRQRSKQRADILRVLQHPERLQNGIGFLARPALADVAAEFAVDNRSL
jgi:hypothetical protein